MSSYARGGDGSLTVYRSLNMAVETADFCYLSRQKHILIIQDWLLLAKKHRSVLNSKKKKNHHIHNHQL